MKAKIILKSLSDLPANAVGLAAAGTGHALEATRQVLAPPVRATRREIREARWRSTEFMRQLMHRAHAPFKNIHPWPSGGLNE